MIVTEPLLAPWLGQHPWVRLLLQIAIVGGLVAIPLWRSLAPRQRASLVVPAIALPWILAGGEIEQRYGMHFDLVAAWHWDDDLFDIVRWVGWLPAALWTRRLVLARSRAVAAKSEHH